MKIKVTVICGNEGYWRVSDVTSWYNMMVEDDGQEKADKYFSSAEFNDEESAREHYGYGFTESLSQSDDCPPFLYTKKIDKIIVERMIK